MKSILELSDRSIRGDDRGYIAYHAPRYAFLLRLLAAHGVTAGSKVLDIGPSLLTDLIGEYFGTAVDSLGLGPHRAAGEATHFAFDLNLTQDRACWRNDLPTYEFVVMAEVLEHLHTAPQLVLAFVRTLLAEDGLLILQTPNAASFQKRVKLLIGRNPYEMIRADSSNPGHFREYTISELTSMAEPLGFSVEKWTTAFYFDARFARHSEGRVAPQPILGLAKNSLYRILPTRLREGITMVWRRRA
jgi:cyclopropane fatty-acyl-phospholipid synthase-like methyltransferase